MFSQNVFFHAHDIEPPYQEHLAPPPFLQYLVGAVVPCSLLRRVLFFYRLILDFFLSFSTFTLMSFQCATTLTNTDTFPSHYLVSFSEHYTKSCKFSSKHSRARPSRSTSSLPILSKTSRPRSRTRKASHLINSVSSLLASSSKTVVRSVTTVRCVF